MSTSSDLQSDANENEKISSLSKDLGKDFSKYVQVDIKNEKTILEEELDDLLMRLDEFSSLVDMVRSDDALCLNNTLPEIYLKSQEMEKLYAKIDKLECAVTVIKQNLDIMDTKVTEAEYALEGSTMKKLVLSLQKPLFSRKPTTDSRKSPKYEAPQIFCTEDLFGGGGGGGSSSSSSDANKTTPDEKDSNKVETPSPDPSV